MIDLHIYSTERIVNERGNPLSQFVTKWQELLRSTRGALVKKSANQTAANYSGGAYITWNSQTYDTSGFHDTATNTDRLTVPKGIARARVGAQVTIDNITASSPVTLSLGKNASAVAYQVVSANSTTVAFQVWSPVTEVVAGDYFRVFMQIPGDSSVDVIAANSWFTIEAVR